RLFYLSEVRS
ncbi:histidine kinase-, DNA gyrase B-, and HSP90-like ATPase family protein, partial [Chlamydia psittaci 08-2626_L3]